MTPEEARERLLPHFGHPSDVSGREVAVRRLGRLFGQEREALITLLGGERWDAHRLRLGKYGTAVWVVPDE